MGSEAGLLLGSRAPLVCREDLLRTMHCGSMGCMCAARGALPLLNSGFRQVGPASQAAFTHLSVANTLS